MFLYVPKVRGLKSVSLLSAFVESAWVVTARRAPPKMLMLLIKGVMGKKVSLLKKVQFLVMFLGAATILLFQVSCSNI